MDWRSDTKVVVFKIEMWVGALGIVIQQRSSGLCSFSCSF